MTPIPYVITPHYLAPLIKDWCRWCKAYGPHDNGTNTACQMVIRCQNCLGLVVIV